MYHTAVILSFVGMIIAQDLQDPSNDRIPQLVEDIGSAIVMIVAEYLMVIVILVMANVDPVMIILMNGLVTVQVM